MTQAIRISKMMVKAVRGITDPITFDFSAPITVVYAPNGTGKTTMCEAAEWLLTGVVHRLRDGKGFDTELLRSRFCEDIDPSVEAAMYLGDAPLHLERKADLNGQSAKFGEKHDEPKAIRPGELLAKIAPVAAAQESHPVRAINLRQQWLRGTRFLSSDKLSALVDSDDDTVDVRKQVFADLLGIRHLLDAETRCNKFIADHAAQLRTLGAEIDRRTDQIERLQAEMEARKAQGPHFSLDAIMAHILQHLGPAYDGIAYADPGHAIPALTAHLEERKSQLLRKGQTLRALEARWDAAQHDKVLISELTGRERALSDQTIALAEKVARLEEAYTTSTTRRRALGKTLRVLAGTRDDLILLANSITQDLPSLPTARAKNLSFVQLLDAVPECAWSEETINGRHARLAEAREARTAYLRSIRHRTTLEAELSIIEAGLATESESLELKAKADQLARIADQASDRLKATQGPVAQLQATARQLLLQEHPLETDECPLCRHEWGSVMQLRAAIEDALGSAPALVKAAQAEAVATSQAADDARARVASADKRADRAQSVKAHIADLGLVADRFVRVMNDLGLSPHVDQAIEDEDQRLAVAARLAKLTDGFEAAQIFQPQTDDLKAVLDFPASELTTRVEARIWEATQEARIQLESVVLEISRIENDRSEARAYYAGQMERLKEAQTLLVSARENVAEFDMLWTDILPEAEPTLNILSEALKGMSHERLELNEVEGQLSAANAVWDIEKQHVQLSALSEGLNPIRKEHETLDRQIKAARRAAATFSTSYQEVSSQQFRELEQVVNPLFARMHANHVFDNVTLGSAAQPMHWSASAQGKGFEPGTDFSQGQRQDFALALFLARARGIGGTFFLDEPMTHLDDLNRVGLLDIFRATVMESSNRLNIVLTTASRSLARHLIEKFAAIKEVPTPEGVSPPLRVIELGGNGRSGVTMTQVYPAQAA
ncbi:DNA repair exonuclease SbcCD ATPase subunit [Sphingobium sp. AP50]|uniref:AAA family ATPase n=1 Tax=Sphingobium sp. AP50 TaxID=1884369 RepID=UPI0008B828BE|nr:AAA family ATPase [Sphingobium sp. AP50]SEJ91748.1 DNA repair exonuclease SbcCD ATPase subunit [Sphingobium sp. AP50]